MATGFTKYLAAAFHAKPLGMFIAPNWIALAGIAIAGSMEPSFLVLGAGLELAYLFSLATNARFQRLVQGREIQKAQHRWSQRQQLRLAGLLPNDQKRYRALEIRCQGILEQQQTLDIAFSDLKAQSDGLARLTWIYLRLLLTRHTIRKVLGDALDDEDSLQERLADLQRQVQEPSLSDDMRKSLSSRAEILQQRIEKQKEAREKVALIDAELTRIEEQVELIREQAAVSADSKGVSDRIDQVAADLSGRSQWLRDQQQVYGKVEDLLAEPPPLIAAPPPAPENPLPQ
jgi:hypothetical protein